MNTEHSRLVALQLNVGSGSLTEQGEKESEEQAKKKGSAKKELPRTSKDCSRYLIEHYITESDREKLPTPDFVGLQDGVKDADIQNVIDAFKGRDKVHSLKVASLKTTGVSLLYNSDTVIELDQPDRASRKQLNRAVEGIFQHKASRQFLAVASYHGLRGVTTSTQKVDNILGKYTNYLKNNKIELLGDLEAIHGFRNPLYLVLGDFNLQASVLAPKLPPSWKLPSQIQNARNVCHRLDYVLVQGFSEASAMDFSPLPLKEDTEGHFRLSNAAGLLKESCEPTSFRGLKRGIPRTALLLNLTQDRSI